jgi:hypothetical protein
MPFKVKIDGEYRLKAQLSQRARKYRGARVVIGYSAPYAAAVHENLAVYHSTGQAKFLEQPCREFEPEIRTIIRNGLLAGQSLEQAQLDAARFLLLQSQKLVPVRTGFLRDSGFVRAE